MNEQASERERADQHLEAADRARTRHDNDRAAKTAQRAGTAPTTEPSPPLIDLPADPDAPIEAVRIIAKPHRIDWIWQPIHHPECDLG